MKVRCIQIRKYDLLNYLNHNWKGFDTKDYELLIAVYFCDFFKKQFGGEHMIGIPVKFNKTSDIGTKYSTENIKNTLQKYTEEDTSVDLFISARKDLKEIPPVGKGKGQAF
jgi:hypothetical protein